MIASRRGGLTLYAVQPKQKDIERVNLFRNAIRRSMKTRYTASDCDVKLNSLTFSAGSRAALPP